MACVVHGTFRLLRPERFDCERRQPVEHPSSRLRRRSMSGSSAACSAAPRQAPASSRRTSSRTIPGYRKRLRVAGRRARFAPHHEQQV